MTDPVARTPRRVMQVFCFEDDPYPEWGQLVAQPVGDLLGQAFLDLGSACEQLDDAGEFAQAEDPLAR